MDSRVTLNRNCEYCGVAFTRVVYPSQNKPNHSRFCSRSCSRKGTSVTAESKQNMAESGKRRWARDGEKALQSVRISDFLADPVNLAARVEQINRNWESPETHQKASLSAKRPGVCEARRIGQQKCLADSEWAAAYSKHMSEVMLRPATRNKSSQSHKDYWLQLPEEQRDAQLRAMAVGSEPYRLGLKRTRIEAAVERVLGELGVVFIPQYRVDRCFLDYYLPDLNLAIECDGDYWHSSPHAQRRDRRREYWLRSKGYIVVRLSETEIKADCRKAVKVALATRDAVVAIRELRAKKVVNG